MMYKKILTFVGLAVIGLLFIVTQFQRSQAQATIRPLTISTLTLASSSDPGGNYPRNQSGAIQNDNYGISVWTGNFPTPYTECGSIGMPANISTTTDPNVANTWDSRNTCNGNVAIGAADDVPAQIITLTGPSPTISASNFTLDVFVPSVPGSSLGNWRLYIDDTGSTYHCRADHNYGTLRYPNDCDLTLEQALVPTHLARASNGAVAGNKLCQAGEDTYTAPQDCGNPKTFSGRATFQSGDAGGSIETNALLTQKVINLQNTGSNADTFRTTLPLNPEARCGLRGSNDPYPENRLPNTLPTTLDTSLAVNETKYITVACVTKDRSPGPFTWSYKTVSSGAVNVNRADVNPVIAEVQDTVNITAPIACSDSDGGMNSSIKGVGTGTYAGAVTSYIAIYGQEPNPTTPKPTTEKYSTFIDHCATTTQLNEGYCDASGRLQAIGLSCPNGCSDGACIASTPPPPPPSSGPSLIGHWKFDGNGSNEVAGSPGAAIVGNASFKTDGGKLGGYLYIPTSADYAKIPYNSIFDLPDSFTIEFWFRQRANRSFLQDLVYKGTPINNYNFRIFRQLWNENNYGPIIAGHTAANTGYWTQPSNPNQLAHNTWHHVVFTKGSDLHAYYLDGVLIGSKVATSQYDSQYFGPAKTPHNDIIIGDSAVDTDIDNLRIYNYALSASDVLQNGGFPPPSPPPPGAGAPEPSNNEPGVWAQVDIATGQVLSSAICTRTVCGINGEYHGYVPPTSFATGSVWWPTLKRYIWQLSGQAGYGSGTFNFNTYVFTVPGGTIYNGVFTPSLTPPGGTSTPTAPITTPSVGTSTSPAVATTPGVSPVALPGPPLPPMPIVPGQPIQPGLLLSPSGPFQPGSFSQSPFPTFGSGSSTPQTPPVSVSQCRGYVSNIRQGLKDDKQFLRDTNRELLSVQSTYADAAKATDLLSQGQKLIIDIEKTAKQRSCDQNTLSGLQEKLDRLHGEIFFELGDHVAEMDTIFGDQFEGQPPSTTPPPSPEFDRKTDHVLEQLGTHVNQLSQDLEKSQKKIDELVAQVAQLNSTLERVTKTASDLSDKIVISYTSLSRMQDKFEAERRQILAGKNRLMTAAEETTRVLEETSCAKQADRQRLAEGFGEIATVNWIDERADALERRLRIIVASCQAKDLTPADIDAFFVNLHEDERANLADSCAKGLTPFCDVPTHEWFYGAMLTGHETGFITKGFPAENVLRQDALLMILRAYGMTDAELVGDCAIPADKAVSNVSPYARCAVARALEKGLTVRGNMSAVATRVELASWIAQLLPLTSKSETLNAYTDLKRLDAKAKEAISKVASSEIMVGHPEKGAFGPFENVTRAALAVALEKLLSVQGKLP